MNYEKVLDAVRDLSAKDLVRLRHCAAYFAAGLAWRVSADDLLQEAIASALDSKRLWLKGSFQDFLLSTMRSLAWNERKKMANFVTVDADIADPGTTTQLEASISGSLVVKQLVEKLGENSLNMRIIYGLGKGLSRDDIRNELEITDAQFDSALRKVRRAATDIQAATEIQRLKTPGGRNQ